MSTESKPRPHLGECPLCEQGLIRVVRCPKCRSISALCDDCEVIWKKPRHTRKSPPDSQHPVCPDCHSEVEQWEFLTEGEIKGQDLDGLIKGHSE